MKRTTVVALIIVLWNSSSSPRWLIGFTFLNQFVSEKNEYVDPIKGKMQPFLIKWTVFIRLWLEVLEFNFGFPFKWETSWKKGNIYKISLHSTKNFGDTLFRITRELSFGESLLNYDPVSEYLPTIFTYASMMI